MLIKILKKNIELIFWLTALLSLAIFNPASQIHFSLCVFKLLGVTWCPGCGIGHAISWLLHGNLHASFKAHWLGLPALAIIFYRIYSLILMQMFTFRELNLKDHGV
ncbi:DUF2752 domain-containing protein [Mucilaginibacter galii]|uniref:DUF2752 domain-containing protein n=1 Tax=Mucilaginibacter galii TaxID=2005073 RepID=UPI001E4D6392|nr:DUF2752 domain-containing protein [Mucilaginibacter galii]